MSQARLAKKAGTSQSAIARIESGEENATETTVERLVNALDGRLRVSIAPAEYPAAPPHIWWKSASSRPETASASKWTMRNIEVGETPNEQFARITIGREFRRNTLPAAADIVIEAKAS
jgi:transcriptional regulator with XRE-family HTH domain